jgi:hypothetical protein
MKKSINILIVVTLVIITVISSCKKDDNINNGQNDALKRYLEIKSKLASFQNDNGESNLNALGASILNVYNKSLKFDGDSTGCDSTYWQNWTCAEVTEYIDAEGNFVTVYDYGEDGCDEWGSIVSGKITYIWSQNDSIYNSEVIYDNYSGYGMTMNGFSRYTYTFDEMNYGNEGDSGVYMINWSGSSSCVEDIYMVTQDGISYHYTADYSSEWDENSYTVHQGEYSYQDITNGFEYTYKINENLFYNYECGGEIWVPVSGVEEIIYVDAQTNTTFVTDYGNGVCDNLATVTENGVSYIVDFGELMYWEPCEGDNCDSVVVSVAY